LNWIQKLVETYDACFRQDRPDFLKLLRVSSVPQTTQLHVELHPDGTFFHAAISELEDTPLFVTEDSASRSGKDPDANPLTEQLEYCAKGIDEYGGKSSKFDRYLAELNAWTASRFSNPKLQAVCTYIQNGSILDDLIRAGILVPKGKEFEKVTVGKRELDPLKLWVRWSVIGERQSATWSDPNLAALWTEFENSKNRPLARCMSSGEMAKCTQKHPKRIRYSADNSKLLSSNDKNGYTYRGRFTDAGQAATVGYVQSQKAHNTLRWLIQRQGTRIGKDWTLVAWSVESAVAPPVLVDSWQFFRDAGEVNEEAPGAVYDGDAGQHFALRLKKAIGGYKQKLDDSADIVVMGLDSATPGRMAILFYRELRKAEFLTRLERWHTSLAWPQNMGKDLRFVGAPSPCDIAEACYGRRVEGREGEKLRKATHERLLPCIVDGRPLPRDLVLAAVASTVRCAYQKDQRKGYWEFERNLGVACSLYRGAHPKESYSMSLDESRTSRDYLYGRLLALADSIEGLALNVARVQRDTTAARLMQRFADHPYSTWRTIELQLTPYIAQLRSSRAAALQRRQSLIDAVYTLFETSGGGESAFLDNHPLSGEFLLGFHSQREALKPRKDNTNDAEPEATPEEGDYQ
jgi:CRISPR-associated protein Csd1